MGNKLHTTKFYSKNEVSKMCGVSLRQLQWWDEKKILSPCRVIHRCAYIAEDVVQVNIIIELRRKGLSFQNVRRVLLFLRHRIAKRLTGVYGADLHLHLVTDGIDSYLEQNVVNIIEILKKSSRPIVLVSVTDQVRRLEANALWSLWPVEGSHGTEETRG